MRFAISVLVVAHVLLLTCLITVQSPTRNEVAHVPAGLTYLLSGSFHVYRVNPPLTRLLQATPVWFANPNIGSLSAVPDGRGNRPEWAAAFAFANDNAPRYSTLMTLARLPGIAWSLGGLWIVCRWSRELYGRRASLLAVTLWCFDPTILAHASLATPDLPCAVACLAAARSFHHYFLTPSSSAAYVAGGLLGVAQLTKFTALVDYLAWAMLAILGAFSSSLVTYRALPLARKSAHAVLAIATSLAVINFGYGFAGTFTELGDFDFVSASTSVPDASDARRNLFAETLMGTLPVPLPADYIRGLDLQQADFEGKQMSFLRGELRNHGWWYFYFYGIVCKVPLGTLALGVAGLALAFARRYRRFDELVLWLPAVAIFMAASAKTGYTMHFRYILPALPFALVGLSKVAECKSRWTQSLVWVLAGLTVISSMRAFPHSLAYFNEPAGGPSNGAAHMVDSNLDWGQDLYRFKMWYDAHPNARPLHLAYENAVGHRHAGLPALPAITSDPTALTPGYYALDIQSLYIRDFGYFLSLAPVDRVGYTIRIYRVSEADVERLRAGDRPP